MKIYIAGKITDEPLNECKSKFERIETSLIDIGATPVNPFKLGCPDTWTFDQCKPTCFEAIEQCDAIYMLADWRNSLGATVELHEAMRLKLDLYFEADNNIEDIADQVKLELVG